MFEIFSHDFMIRAFLVAAVISIITPLIGNIAVLKRLSTVGDALSHSGLAGVAIGLCLSVNPVVMAVAFSVLASLALEWLRRVFPKYSEISTSVIMSLGAGLAAVFSGFVKKNADFNSFLFGSIVAIPDDEAVAVLVLGVAVVALSLFLYNELFYIVFDEEGAAVAGVPVRLVNTVFTVLTAVTVSIAARTVGALIISSLMTTPVACSLLVSRSFKQNTVLSVCFAFFFTMSGLFAAYYLDLKPGGTIVLISVAVLVIMSISKWGAGLHGGFAGKANKR